MSSTQTITEDATERSAATTLNHKLEVVALPVADVDRSKRFYEGLGWRVDADFAAGSDWRLVQMTPPGSACSVMFGKGFTTAAPGSVQGTFIVVDDLEATRDDMIARGIAVTEVFHFDGDLLNLRAAGHAPGPDPQGRSYFSFATFTDPDGNGWLLQQVTARFPGRGFSVDVPTVTALLRETEERHGEYEAAAPKHHWSEWYAAYLVARMQGRTSEQAATDAALHMEGTRDEVPA